MLTIEVTQEQYDFLRNAKNLLATQDNRFTRDPIYYYKYRDHVPTGSDWEDDHCFRNPDSTEVFHSDEAFIEYVKDNHCTFWDALEAEYKKSNPEFDFSVHCEAEAKSRHNYISEGDDLSQWFIQRATDDEETLEEFEKELDGYEYIPTKEVQMNYDSGCFSFFEKDLEYHKDMNGHNFRRDTYSYAGSLQRTPLMEELLAFLKEVKV